jgi:hypothetical protein
MTTYGLKYVGRTVDTGRGSDGSAKANAKICALFGSTNLQSAACKPRKKSQPALGLPRPKLICHLGYCPAVRVNGFEDGYWH